MNKVQFSHSSFQATKVSLSIFAQIGYLLTQYLNMLW